MWKPGWPRRGAAGRQGSALLMGIIIAMSLLMITAISINMTLVHSVARKVHEDAFLAKQIAESAASQAIARIREGGFTAPKSGSGAAPAWVPFSTGEFYYYTTYDPVTDVSIIRAWGRVASRDNPGASAAAPDSSSWDGSGWMVKGLEVSIKAYAYVPESPLYFGNGGIEKPMGGFKDWTSGTDPANPSTWSTVTSIPTSYQASWVPFVASALDHPANYNYAGGIPAPASSNPHPYSLWTAQNLFGQFNIEAWFANSAGSGSDPTTKLSPPPSAAFYDMSSTSPDFPYPIDPKVPDVQDYSWRLWAKYKDDPSTVMLGSGSHSGTYGDLAAPRVTFVTGALTVPSASAFEGAGILVIRDNYDPNVDTNNTPAIKASLQIQGQFKWTGLVIIAGWAPGITVDSGGDGTIVGALFGEDSVQSGGEVSLDSATIGLIINDDFRVLYSSALFLPGGLIRPFLPSVSTEVIGVRSL